MDNLARAKRWFQMEAYQRNVVERNGLDVDKMTEAQAKAALKRVLGVASECQNSRYIIAAQEAIEELEGRDE